jgi:hypothetical protein
MSVKYGLSISGTRMKNRIGFLGFEQPGGIAGFIPQIFYGFEHPASRFIANTGAAVDNPGHRVNGNLRLFADINDGNHESIWPWLLRGQAAPDREKQEKDGQSGRYDKKACSQSG